MVKSLKGLYAITDPNLIADNELYDKVSQAIEGGIAILQYRNKTAEHEIQYQQAKMLSTLCKTKNVIFIINDNIQLAKQVCADGVHLGKTDQQIHLAREQLGETAIIGISCYNDLNRAIDAQKEGASYVAFGRFFPSKTKPKAIQADLNLLSQATKKLSIPIIAIGGINDTNIHKVITYNIESVAIINAIFAQKDVKKAVQQLNKHFLQDFLQHSLQHSLQHKQ